MATAALVTGISDDGELPFTKIRCNQKFARNGEVGA